MDKSPKTKENCNDISIDTVYSEMYEEMRRFRDYELKISNWYTVVLLTMLGVILTIKFTPIPKFFI